MRSISLEINEDTNEDGDGFQLSRFQIMTGFQTMFATCDVGHQMIRREGPRFDGNNWCCDNCGNEYGPEPGFEWYTCTNTDHSTKDYCPDCYPEMIEKPDIQEGW